MRIERLNHPSIAMKNAGQDRLVKVIYAALLICTYQIVSGTNVYAQMDNQELASTVRLLREIPSVRGVALSPTGSQVAFVVNRQTVADGGRISQDLFVQPLSSSGERSGPADKIASIIVKEAEQAGKMISFQWCPGSDCILFSIARRNNAVSVTPEIAKSGKLLRMDLASKTSQPIEVAATEVAGNPRITSVPSDYKVSNSGRYLAFTAQTVPGKKESPDVGVRMTPVMLRGGFFTKPGKDGIFILDTETGKLRQITPDRIDTTSFSWGPGDSEIVFSGIEGELTDSRFCSESSLQDIFVVTVDSGVVRKVVSQPGSDAHPLMSPDRKWITFRSTFGGTEVDATRLALVPAAGGEVEQLTDEEVTGVDPIAWGPDSRTIYFRGESDIAHRLKRVYLGTRKITDVLNFGKTTTSLQYSVNQDGKRVAFVPESFIEPQELFVRDVESGRNAKVTDLSPEFALRGKLRLERVSWQSGDGKFQVQGFLIIPESAWPKGSPAPPKPLPMLTLIQGGPTMVWNWFAPPHPSVLEMAMQGFLVFVPNTRGRGGNGVKFFYGMAANGPGRGHPPYLDVNSGVDALVKRGIADPDRLGIYGHSYGGYLTAYAITQTNRFRAAINFEGPVNDLYNSQQGLSTGASGCLHSSKFGVKNPFEPAEMEKLAAQTPNLNLYKVRTPTLLIFGSQSAASADGRMMADGLRRLGVPSEFIVYDAGHGLLRYSHVVDMNERVRDWFNYWLLDKPYPEKELEKEYNSWRGQVVSNRNK